MHIKQVVIRGFKTYKEQVSLPEDLHKGVNVVVGFNGAGKSNFFNAILFVISDHFGTLRAETRKALLHEGTGPAVLTAFVELAFDNTDRRMPIDRDEVRVRRTIAAKKDDYMLDGRHATKAEVFNLLESCGFSKSNPYYIVQQGKIAELTLMNDVRRLELLKEISGASVFDERRSESRKIMDEMTGREQQTDKVVDFIRQRIKNLEEEQKELLEYQKLEHRRRCIEFELTDRDWRTAQDRIVGLDRQRQDASMKLSEAQREASELREKLGAVEGELEQLAGRRQRMAAEREEADRQRATRSEDLARLGLELDDQRKRATGGERLVSEARAELKKVQADLQAAEQELAVQAPVLEQRRQSRREAAQRRQLDEARRDQLLAKQRRLASYSSIAERNAALQTEMRRHEGRQEQYRRLLEGCQGELLRAGQQQGASEARMAELRGAIQKLQVELDRDIAAKLRQATRQLEECSERKRTLTQERDRQQRAVADVDREAGACQGRIDATMPRPQRNALAAVAQWAEREGKAEAVHGTLLDNIEVPPEYHIAAESTAGGALFNLLVRDDVIAAEIITEVRTRTLGSIVCTPLNRLAAAPKTYGYPNIAGVKPLVEVVKCNEIARPAVQQIFGRMLVCSSLELCDEVSRKYGFDTITADGDKVSCRGTLSGGYQDPARFTRIRSSMKLRATKRARRESAAKFEAANQQADAEAEELVRLHNERNGLQDERADRRDQLSRAVEGLHEAERQVERYREAARRHRERMDEVQNFVQEVATTMEGLREELASDVLGELPAAEQGEMQRLSRVCREHEEMLVGLEEECHGLECALKDKEALVQDVWRKRREQLEDEIRRATHVDHEEHVHEHELACKRLKEEHSKVCDQVAALTRELAAVDSKIDGQRAAKEHHRLGEGELQERISEAEADLDDLVSRINALAKKKHEADEKMRTMTFVSSDVAQYKGLSGPELLKELSRTASELSKFEHVNKKAIDQFATFTGQLEELETNQTKQRQSRGEIEKFLKQVDDQKEETLKETLKAVDNHFRAIFAELVDGGRGRLLMVQADGAADDEEETAGEAKGVRVEVSFTGHSGSAVTMAQLSGGQKTVVAIALIFAIQRLEPAPFYLFDEIDAALDTQYRTAVARLIERDAANAQMIITTFRPEIIEKSHQLYRVRQTNRVSRLEAVTAELAREVIEEQARQEVIDG